MLNKMVNGSTATGNQEFAMVLLWLRDRCRCCRGRSRYECGRFSRVENILGVH